MAAPSTLGHHAFVTYAIRTLPASACGPCSIEARSHVSVNRNALRWRIAMIAAARRCNAEGVAARKAAPPPCHCGITFRLSPSLRT
eukprot:3919730-Pleurochrysis_carterae.AAC.3